MSSKRFELNDEFCGGHLVGEFEASYEDLFKILGEPNGETDGYKVSTEWNIKDNTTGEIWTLYDWKCTDTYGPGLPSVENFRKWDSYGWHIGGLTNNHKHLVEYLTEEISNLPEEAETDAFNTSDIYDTSHTFAGLCGLAAKMGYKDPMHQMTLNDGSCVGDLICFFDDNPDAIEAVIQWVGRNSF